jgi:PhzF family phenazine biosynthesis protein
LYKERISKQSTGNDTNLRGRFMRSYTIYQIDSFTKEKFTGNPAGVVTHAEGLSDLEMQKIARELNNSETAFIFTSKHPEYDLHIRFFTPTSEVPICGHATIAAHYARALENRLESTRVLHKTGAGILPVDVVKEDGDYKIVMTQGKIEYGAVLKGDNKEELLAALQLKEDDLLEDCPVQIVSTGHSKVMIGIKSTEMLHSLKPNYDMLARLSASIQCNGYYVFTKAPEESDILIHGRMFAPAIGINEDPVTGNANGPLGVYLVHHNLVQHDGKTFKFKAMQGEAIKRTGVIEVEVTIEDREPSKVMISGSATVVFKTEISLND